MFTYTLMKNDKGEETRALLRGSLDRLCERAEVERKR